eukprot:scaffold4357_cov113-Isochrysis_galbana.AAC.15
MSWDEWVDVQMEARPISGRANHVSRTLFHGPRVALRAEQWLSQSMRPSPRLGARLLERFGVVYRVFVNPWFGGGGGALARRVEDGFLCP